MDDEYMVRKNEMINHTDMHVDNHSISLHPTNDGRNYHQRIFGNKIPYASFWLMVPIGESLKIEFEGFCAYKEQQKSQQVME